MRRTLFAALAAALLASCSEEASNNSGNVPAATDATASGGDAVSEAGDVPGEADKQDPAPDDAADAGPATRFHFEPITLAGAEPWWGPSTAGSLLVGGMSEIQAVQDGVYVATPVPGGYEATRVATLDRGRYCACALHDAGREELVVVGGRTVKGGIVETSTAALVDLKTGAASALEPGGAADYPVGCMAFFSPAQDRGYVFGGLSGAKQGFTAATHRWTPVERTFTQLDAPGPAGRYDAAMHVTNDGGALMVSGMGAGAKVLFYNDVWRFDAAAEAWSEVEVSSATRPPGRRYAWSALAPDESVLVFGYGSDSPTGQSVLGDLWLFDLATHEWAPLEVDGALPLARGFTPNWRVPGADAGILAFGADPNLLVVEDAYVLRVPDSLKGDWH